MTGDFSRQTFHPLKHYSAVLMQQGRVQVDADWNEQQAINQHRVGTEAADVIGPSGAPLKGGGFQIGVAPNGSDLTISSGHIYVDGILCELEAPTTYLAQPMLINPPALDRTIANHLVYLDVWQRLVTAVEDPSIREVALGGADTAIRLQVVTQVKILPLHSAPASVACDSPLPEWDTLTAPGSDVLNVRTQPASATLTPCLLPPSAGYQRLENQLYRVEIHQGGSSDAASFKWSRENGSIVTGIDSVDGQRLTLHDAGPDDIRGFGSGQWVEIVDDLADLGQRIGQVVQITNVDPVRPIVTISAAPNPALDMALHPRLRRWDSNGLIPLATTTTADGWIPLEDGIQVQFGGDTFAAGDYWLIPARTATGEVEWPPFAVPNTTPIPQPPAGVKHHYARLALVHVDVPTGALTVQDCRPRFPALTELDASVIAYDPMACSYLASALTVQAAIDLLCQRRDFEAGIHITDIRTVNPDASLHNDGSVSVTALANGIRTICDTPVDPATIARPTYFVTLELPFPLDGIDPPRWGSGVLGTRPLTLDVEPSVQGNVIAWIPSGGVQAWMTGTQAGGGLPQMMKDLAPMRSILTRLTLKGNFISAAGDSSLYLDGDTYGTHGPGSTGLTVPTGDGRRGGTFEMWFWLVPPTGISALTLDALTAIGTITLRGPAPVGGASVSLTNDNPAVVTGPSSVTVPEGALTATFQIVTTPVNQATTVTITATFENESQSAPLVVGPSLNSLGFNPPVIRGGAPVQGIVTLLGPAPDGGIIVSLNSQNPILTVPDTVTVPAGQTATSFQVTPGVVTNPTSVSVTASYQGIEKLAPLTLAPGLTQVAFNPNPVNFPPDGGSATVTGTVTLAGPAPSGGIVINLASDSAFVTVPVSTTVSANAASQSFTITVTAPGFGAFAAIITATQDAGAVVHRTLNVLRSPALTGLSFNPTQVTGGGLSTGTITLGGGVLPNTQVSLSSDNPSVAVPAAVPVPAGASSVTFFAQTTPVSQSTVATITASFQGSTQPAQLTVSPAILSGLALPGAAFSGDDVFGTVTLNGPVPTNTTVGLSSSNVGIAAVDNAVVIPAGQASAGITVSTDLIGHAIITASLAGSPSVQAGITVRQRPKGQSTLLEKAQISLEKSVAQREVIQPFQEVGPPVQEVPTTGGVSHPFISPAERPDVTP